MEILTLVLTLGLLLWIRNSIGSDIKNLSREIKILRDSLRESQQHFPEKPEAKKEIIKEEPPAPVTPPIVIQPESPLPFVKEEVVEEVIYPFKEEPAVKLKEYFEPELNVPSPNIPRKTKPTFFERNPDLEKFIGENLINKIGIGILVLGIAFFVKYAIDQNWINEIGRVSIGILCGGILIGIAHYMRKKFKAFSSVLIGGGLSVLYFTIGIAFHIYHLFSQEAAFGIMVVITAFAIVLSITYDRIELAVLALIGGFCTPYIVSTGEGNYQVLFTYLLILNGGMLVLAYKKKWNLVNILSYVFTILSYGSWLLVKCIGHVDAPYAGALIFGTAFYIVFFLMNIIYNLKNNIPFKVFEIGMLLSNTFLYYAAGMSILYYYYNTTYQGLFTALIGVFNFGFAFAFYKNKNIDRNLIFLLIGLVLTFVSLTAPIQLEGNHITLFWAAEAVLLLWLSQKSGIKLIKGTSLAISLLMLISLLMDWGKFYADSSSALRTPFLNQAFITGIASIVSIILSIRLLANEKEPVFVFKDFSIKTYKSILQILFTTLLYFSFLLEINFQLVSHGYHYEAVNVVTGIYNYTFVASMFFILRKNTSQAVAVTLMVAAGLCLLAFPAVYNQSIIDVRDNYLEQNSDALFFMLHFLLISLFALTIYIFNSASKKYFLKSEDWIKWAIVFFIVYGCSAEVNHIVTWISYSPGRIIYEINRQIFKAGYTVLWGIISLILIQQGMKNKDRTLRIISLSLFFLTILKLFFWDIRGISESGKIIAFISLGALLLLVSFMYQRLKRLILEGETSSSESKEEKTL